MPPAQISYPLLHERAGEILHYVWDPIGIAGTPGARDEYDSYVPAVVRMVVEKKDQDLIAGHLNQIAVERMGLTSSGESQARARLAAKRLIEHHEWLEKRG